MFPPLAVHLFGRLSFSRCSAMRASISNVFPGVTLFNLHDDAHPSLKPLFRMYTPGSPDLSLTEYDVSPWKRWNTAKIRGGRPFLFNRSHIGCLGADGAFLSQVPARSIADSRRKTPLLVHHDAQIFKMFGAP